MTIVNFIKNLKLSIVYMSIISAVCLMSFNRIPNLEPFMIKYVDKIVHFTMYLGFFILLSFEFPKYYSSLKSNKNPLIASILVAFFYGALIEVMQMTITQNRSAELLDLVANSVGIGFGLITYKVFHKIMIAIGF